MDQLKNTTLNSISILAISSGVAQVALDGEDWIRNLIIGLVLVLIGVGLNWYKYYIQTVQIKKPTRKSKK